MKIISMMIKNMLMTFKSMTKVHQRHHEGDFNDDQEHVDFIQEHDKGTSASSPDRHHYDGQQHEEDY